MWWEMMWVTGVAKRRTMRKGSGHVMASRGRGSIWGPTRAAEKGTVVLQAVPLLLMLLLMG